MPKSKNGKNHKKRLKKRNKKRENYVSKDALKLGALQMVTNAIFNKD